jgi:hypothetical protein
MQARSRPTAAADPVRADETATEEPAPRDVVGRFLESPNPLYRRRHRELYDYWQARRPAPNRLPARADIDPSEIPHLLGAVWMTDVVRTERSVRFRERLVGTAMVELYGFETTGRWFEEIYEGRHLARQLATYRAIAAGGRPHLSRLGVPRRDREFLIYDRLILPLAADGRTPDILLGIHAYAPEQGEDPTTWPEPDVAYDPAAEIAFKPGE